MRSRAIHIDIYIYFFFLVALVFYAVKVVKPFNITVVVALNLILLSKIN